MLTLERSDTPPQMVLRIAGTIEEDDLHEAVRLQAEDSNLALGVVVVIEYTEPSTYRPAAGGTFVFLLGKLLAAKPKAVLIVGPDKLDTDVPSAREVRRRTTDDERVHFFETRAEADAFIETLES